MVISCVAYGCTNKQHKKLDDKSSSLHFHRFPLKRPELLQKWVAAVRRKNWNPTKYSFLCSNHFSEDCYVFGLSSDKALLKENAVPDVIIFRDDLQSSGNRRQILHEKENFTDKANESPRDVIETPTPQEDHDRETTNLKRSAASPGTLRVKRSKLGAVSAVIQELKVLKECINQPSSESECDVFGKHVAMQLKTLSTEQRVLAQEAIQSAITHCRLQDLHKQCSSSCTEQFITESEKQADGSANVENTWLKEEEEEYELGLNVEEIKFELQEVEEED